jgi:hypothetical protein
MSIGELNAENNLEYCERMGYDSAKNGSNTTNCDFRIFGTKEGMKSWEKGKRKFELEQFQKISQLDKEEGGK